MKYTPHIIIGVALLLFVSCGQQQKAKSAVKDFVENQMQQDVSYLDFSDVDSTRAISDSLVNVMREKGGKNVRYHNRRGNKLLHIRAKYLLEKDTMSATFYLEPEEFGVVAYKRN
ncbi:MAG: hypothetical protein K6E67_01870 [Prevotella sp.]|nr:hypothetical protein [Prevotella sp.]